MSYRRFVGSVSFLDAPQNMSYDPVAFAELQVAQYDAVMRDHLEAMDSFDCQETLDRGIQALAWLERAEQTVVSAEEDCLVEYSPVVHELIDRLYRTWLNPCHQAEAWATRVLERGYSIDNLPEFRKSCARARTWIENADAIADATLSHDRLKKYSSSLQ